MTFCGVYSLKMGKTKTAGKGKSISAVKKGNIRRHKLVKSGQLKPKSKPKFLKGGHLQDKKSNKWKKAPKSAAELAEKEKEIAAEKKQREDETYAQMADMMDPEDLEYLQKNAKSRKLFDINIDGGKSGNEKVAQKDSSDDEEDFEGYEKAAVARIHMTNGHSKEEEKALLPIKTKDGWKSRSHEPQNGQEEEEASVKSESGEEMEVEQEPEQEATSVVEILAKRKILLDKTKLQLGSMATNFLESPEERIPLLERMVKFMTLGHNDPAVENTVIKLASATVLEILKDIWPNYKIMDHTEEDKNVKLKKDTLRLHRYETALLGCAKRFLVKCERLVSASRSKTTPSAQNMSIHALKCMTALLVAHPEFNYTENVIQFIVPYMNSKVPEIRRIVSSSVQQLFREDKKGQVSLLVVRSINHQLKTKARVQPEMLNSLLSLKLYHLENPQDIATAHLKEENAKGKKRREDMSKKERKYAKARAKLDNELLAAKGEEATSTRLKFATDISNLLFAVYFRLVKNPAGGSGQSVIVANRPLLRPVLTGLAKFGHLMSVNYFADLLEVLSGLLDKTVGDGRHFLGNREALLCIQTVLAILAGQGGQLTLDPHRFYNHLERVLGQLDLNADSWGDRGEPLFQLFGQVFRHAYITRRKKVSRHTLLQALKQVGVAALQQSEVGGAAEYSLLLKECIAAHPPSVGVALLEKDDDVEVQGAGQSTMMPTSKSGCGLDPLLWEVCTLTQHCCYKTSSTSKSILGSKHITPKTKLKVPKNVVLEKDAHDHYNFDILTVK